MTLHTSRAEEICSGTSTDSMATNSELGQPHNTPLVQLQVNNFLIFYFGAHHIHFPRVAEPFVFSGGPWGGRYEKQFKNINAYEKIYAKADFFLLIASISQFYWFFFFVGQGVILERAGIFFQGTVASPASSQYATNFPT